MLLLNGAVGFASLLCFFSLASSQKLTKPPLHPDLDYLTQGLMNNLHSTPSKFDQWAAGWIPADCKTMAQNAGLNPADVQTFNVHYSDCGEAWVLCRHINSPSPLANLIDRFGRLPVSMRQWVRHIIALPHPSGGFAYNWNGNIAMFNIIDNINVFVHETGHSLDLLGAYPNKPLSNSADWNNNYNQDADVPDPYSQTNEVEDVAQVTVVALFDKVVPGGFRKLEPGWNKVFHQYATLQAQAGSTLVPGGKCTHRLTNSAAVHQVAAAAGRVDVLAPMPDTSLSNDVEVIPPKEFNTTEH